jgi:hypothetical protein
MKAKPGQVGIKTLLREIRRLRFVTGFEIQKGYHLEADRQVNLTLTYQI